MKNRVVKIERRRLSDQIIDHFVGMISRGELKVGDMLPPEPELMRQFGVGRSSLREAIGALSLIGIVSVRPGYGTQIIASDDTFLQKPLEWSTSIRNETIEELIEARIVIEEAVAGVAAMRATDEDIAELKHIIEQINAIKKNRKKTVPLDLVFHRAIARSSHNSVLLRTVSELRQLMRVWLDQNASFVSSDDIDRLLIAHTEIVQAIQKKDAEEARSAMRNHLIASSKNLRLTLINRQLRARSFQT
jgi:GntR family transcriptional repressor for pyruvate dehydrogenase complex